MTLNAMKIFVTKLTVLCLIGILTSFTLVNFKLAYIWSSKVCNKNTKYLTEAENVERHWPLILISGYPNSGATLMKTILDAHPVVRCGAEMRFLPNMIDFITGPAVGDDIEKQRLIAAGVTEELLENAFAKFFLEINRKDRYKTARLCNKVPLLLQHGRYMIDLFPNAKFIFMIRDGRAAAHALIRQNHTMGYTNVTDYDRVLREWNEKASLMNTECLRMGEKYCLKVYYEQLILQPKHWLRKILSFLDLPYNVAVETDAANETAHPIYLKSITSWVKYMPEDVKQMSNEIAPMLNYFGYKT